MTRTLDVVIAPAGGREVDEDEAAGTAGRLVAAEARGAGWSPSRPGGTAATLFLDEPSALMVPGGLPAALALLGRTGRGVVPWGVYPGAAALPEPYATVWELEALAAGTGPEPILAVAGATPPARLAPTGFPEGGPFLASPGWLVHSFRGRKGHPRPELLPLVPIEARSVLEVGCGEGAFGASLEARGVAVTGIEPDRRAAALARRRLSRLLDVTFDKGAGLLAGEAFDAVVLADVLEHLPDPVGALRTVRSLLRPGGEVVFSLPNAQHASVLAGMLQGRWDRALEGVVSFGHLTYAGRSGWERVLSAGGFAVSEWRGSMLQPPSLAPWVDLFAWAGLAPDDLLSVQWTGRARVAGKGPSVDLPQQGEAVGSNPVFAPVVEAVLRGELVEGKRARWALVRGTTRHEREALSFEAAPRASVTALPPLLHRLVSEARRRDLSVAVEDFRVETWLASSASSAGERTS